MDAQIHGTVLPVLEVTLNPGDTIVSEAGEMSWMTQSIEMTTTTQTACTAPRRIPVPRVARTTTMSGTLPSVAS